MVEIIVTIAVIGILASVAIVGWAGVQTWSQNNARAAELQQWASAFDLYKARFAGYPGMPDGLADGTYYYCLGDFAATGGKCGEYTSAATSKFRAAAGPDSHGLVAASIRTELTKVGQTPGNSAAAVNNVAIGPYVVFTKSTSGSAITIDLSFVGLFKGAVCPDDTVVESSPPMGGSISDIIACKVTRTITYG